MSKRSRSDRDSICWCYRKLHIGQISLVPCAGWIRKIIATAIASVTNIIRIPLWIRPIITPVSVPETDKKIVGYCLASVAKYPPAFELKEYGAIFDLSVTRDYRRKGLGKKLLHGTYSWFSSKGIKRIEARVATSNEIAQGFWRKMGFGPYMEILFLEKNTT